MRLIKNNKVTTINSLEDARRLKEQRALQKKIKQANNNVESLLQKLTEASDILKSLGITSIMINDNHLVLGTVIDDKFYEGLVIKVENRIFQILNNNCDSDDCA